MRMESDGLREAVRVVQPLSHRIAQSTIAVPSVHLPPSSFFCACAVLCALAGIGCGAAEEKPVFTVLFTAEAHGALLPCDCPLQLIGGAARRATLISRFRERGPVLLVDAGNWAAGGAYDEESDGDAQRDALRTVLMARAMALMRYDVVALGQTERALLEPLKTGLPTEAKALHSHDDAGNEERKTRILESLPQPLPAFLEPLASALETGKTLSCADCSVEVGVIPDAGQNIAGDGGPSGLAHFRVILSQVGEERTTVLVKDACDLAINAGRKDSTRTSWTSGKAVVANFDYQVQHLGVAEVFRLPSDRAGSDRPRWDVRVRFVPLTKEIPEDPEVLALLLPHLETLRKKGKRYVPVEVFVNAECPYWLDLAPELARIAKELSGRVAITPHFLVRKTADGKYRAPHGERELQENRIQALVFRYYPERFWEWLAWRAKHPEAPWDEGVRALGLVRARLAGALEAGEAEALLELDALLALRRHAEATPTLIIGNRLYDGEMGRLQMLRVFCGLLDEPRPAACKTVPACFVDAQCRRRGFVGHCRDAGTPQARCDYSQKAVRVPAVVLVERGAIYDNHERILETLLNWLPGLEWRVLEPGEGEGKDLAERVRPERYPAVLLDPIARTEADFEKNLGDVMEVRGGWLALKPAASGANRIVGRPRRLGQVDLFVSRFSRTGQEAVDVALTPRTWPVTPELRIHDALYWHESLQPDGKVKRDLASRNGVAELQEAAILAAVRQVAPAKLVAYLRERGKRRGSLFWDRALEAADIDVPSVRLLVEGPQEAGFSEAVLRALGAEADLLAALKAGGEVVLLAENCEIVPVRSREELAEYLERIGRRRGAFSAKENAPSGRPDADSRPIPSRSQP